MKKKRKRIVSPLGRDERTKCVIRKKYFINKKCGDDVFSLFLCSAIANSVSIYVFGKNTVRTFLRSRGAFHNVFGRLFSLSLSLQRHVTNLLVISFSLILRKYFLSFFFPVNKIERNLCAHLLREVFLSLFCFVLFFRYALETFTHGIECIRIISREMDELLNQSVLKPGFHKNYKVPVNDKSTKILKRIKKVTYLRLLLYGFFLFLNIRYAL